MRACEWSLNICYQNLFYLHIQLCLELSLSLLLILPNQKQLLYRTCVLPITLYGFQLWFFKGAPTVKNLSELKKMQQRAAL